MQHLSPFLTVAISTATSSKILGPFYQRSTTYRSRFFSLWTVVDCILRFIKKYRSKDVVEFVVAAYEIVQNGAALLLRSANSTFAEVISHETGHRPSTGCRSGITRSTRPPCYCFIWKSSCQTDKKIGCYSASSYVQV